MSNGLGGFVSYDGSVSLAVLSVESGLRSKWDISFSLLYCCDLLYSSFTRQTAITDTTDGADETPAPGDGRTKRSQEKAQVTNRRLIKQRWFTSSPVHSQGDY
jgi:hypothetical protein